MDATLDSPASRLRVIVLTCEGLGLETAAALETVEGIDVVAVMNSPHRRLPFGKKLRKIWRGGGLPGVVRAIMRRITGSAAPSSRSVGSSGSPRCPIFEVMDLHSDECISKIRMLRPDVAVVDGTYILKARLFDLPRLGSINLHCGKVPEYRGSPPAFWELYDGATQVGITIHRVTDSLDGGPILAEEAFPLDAAPAIDPVQYAHDFWRTVLRPNGIRMLQQTLPAMHAGTVRPRPQPASAATTHKTPSYGQVKELRRRVRERRRASVSSSVRG
jgi:methionyl-tRNA formyltransferase